MSVSVDSGATRPVRIKLPFDPIGAALVEFSSGEFCSVSPSPVIVDNTNWNTGVVVSLSCSVGAPISTLDSVPYTVILSCQPAWNVRNDTLSVFIKDVIVFGPDYDGLDAIPDVLLSVILDGGPITNEPTIVVDGGFV